MSQIALAIQEKLSVSKDFYWDPELERLHQKICQTSSYATFKYASPREFDKSAGMTSKSINSVDSNDFSQSQQSHTARSARRKVEMIKEKYEQFKNFVETNTQEELVSVRNFMFG